jgi:multidrug resistance efflux pump
LRLRPNERVLAVPVATGKTVKAGECLAEILDGEAWMRLQELKRARLDALVARAELPSKQSRLERLDAELKAQRELWKAVEPASVERRVFSLQEKRDELSEQIQLLQLRVADSTNLASGEGVLGGSLDSQIKQLETQLSTSQVLAPFDGSIAFVASEPKRAAVGETVLELWDTNVVVRAEVLQHHLPHISAGCRADVSLDFSGNPPIPASVESIESKADAAAGEAYPTFGVRLKLEGVAAQLRPGMRVSVRIYPQKGGNPGSP